MSTRAAPAFSVVVPSHNEAGNIAPLFNEIVAAMMAVGRPFEIIYVNDGSADTTLEELRTLAARTAYLRILDLDGNYGEAAALSAGFQAARGELVITMDGDGQNDPRDIPRLLAVFEHHGLFAVSGWRQEREEGFMLRVLPSRLANYLIAAVSGLPTHDNGCGLKIYRRHVVELAALPRGMNRFVPAIFGVKTHQFAEVPVKDRRRRHGRSHYGIGRTVIVLRDLLALRFIISDPKRSEPVWAMVVIAGLAASLYALWAHNHLLGWISAAVALVALMITWNLRRFNRAQRDGVFRVRCEYSSVEPHDAAGAYRAAIVATAAHANAK